MDIDVDMDINPLPWCAKGPKVGPICILQATK